MYFERDYVVAAAVTHRYQRQRRAVLVARSRCHQRGDAVVRRRRDDGDVDASVTTDVDVPHSVHLHDDVAGGRFTNRGPHGDRAEKLRVQRDRQQADHCRAAVVAALMSCGQCEASTAAGRPGRVYPPRGRWGGWHCGANTKHDPRRERAHAARTKVVRGPDNWMTWWRGGVAAVRPLLPASAAGRD